MGYLKTKTKRIVVSKKQKKNKKFEIDKSATHPSLPKVPKKKKNKKVYFGLDVQDAIIRYNALDSDKNQSERNKIYSEEIHYAFDKLCENIINTFKFEYFDDVYVDVKHATVVFLVMNIHKYDHTKGSKAFSYFSVVAKNYLIMHNNANYKKYKTHHDISILDDNYNSFRDEKKTYITEFVDEMVEYFEKNITRIFNNKKDIAVAYAIMELIQDKENIENFNKKALYILIREMTNVNTSSITKVTNVMKKQYKKLLVKFDKNGTIDDNNLNKFF